ncbi:hypothetical protein Tco_0451908 [Tanacetum coccineum]
MSTTNQGMSFAELEQIVAHRVANVIENIAIYETKTRMARESMSQIKQQEDKMAKNASNKRKWESAHGGSTNQQQNKEPKVIRAHTARPRNKKGYAGILPLIGLLAYQLELLRELSNIHVTFHTSNLEKRMSNESLVIPMEELQVDDKHLTLVEFSPTTTLIILASRLHPLKHFMSLVIPLDGIQIDDKLHFFEELMKVMDREVKQLKQSCIPIIKVRWNSRRGPEFT